MLALHNDDRQKHMSTHLTCVAVIKVCENKHVVNRELELITELAKETTDTSHDMFQVVPAAPRLCQLIRNIRPQSLDCGLKAKHVIVVGFPLSFSAGLKCRGDWG